MEKARDKKEQKDARGEKPEECVSEEETQIPRHRDCQEQVARNREDISRMKSWFLRSMAMCMNQPEIALQSFKALLQQLESENPSLSSIGLFESDAELDLSTFGERLDKVEKQQRDIQADLAQVGPSRKRRGRPFGSSNKPKTTSAAEGDEDGPLLTPPKKARTKSGRKGKARDKGEAGESEKGAGMEVEGEPSEGTDPFAELEEKEPNKGVLISLYAKCLVVKTAKEVRAADRVHNVEMEVMKRFPKYFYSYESNRWKTGLLHKWTKSLVLAWHFLLSLHML